MRRSTRGVTAGIVVLAAALLGSPVHAQTTTTTSTSSTTSTTLHPHPYSKATRTCVRQANRDSKGCTDTPATCLTQFQAAFSNCFATGAGVKCAKSCVTKEGTCLTAAPASRTTCVKACRVTRRRDVFACHSIADGDNLWAGGDGSCLTTAAASFDLCKAICAQAVLDCHTNFRFCIADCPNL
jgi:hypothetical protein